MANFPPLDIDIEKAAPLIDEYQMRQVRQLALQHAVTTHGATHDDDQVVAAAKAYVAFLTGTEPEQEQFAPVDKARLSQAYSEGREDAIKFFTPSPAERDHAKQWEDAAKDVRWPVPSSTFTTPADSLAGPAPLRTYNPYG